MTQDGARMLPITPCNRPDIRKVSCGGRERSSDLGKRKRQRKAGDREGQKERPAGNTWEERRERE